MGTTAVAAAAGFLAAGTAPDENHRRNQHDEQRKKLLPVHAANITAIASRANGIFGVELSVQPPTLRVCLNRSATCIASATPNAPSATTSTIRATLTCWRPRAAN